MVGALYMPVRAQERETCDKTSDNVLVPIDEFRLALDGAVRLARSFDDGVSECGLVCPGPVLALDFRLDPHYKEAKMAKAEPVDTSFPCNEP